MSTIGGDSPRFGRSSELEGQACTGRDECACESVSKGSPRYVPKPKSISGDGGGGGVVIVVKSYLTWECTENTARVCPLDRSRRS